MVLRVRPISQREAACTRTGTELSAPVTPLVLAILEQNPNRRMRSRSEFCNGLEQQRNEGLLGGIPRAAARLRDKISDEEVASVNAALARSLAQLKVKRRRRV